MTYGSTPGLSRGGGGVVGTPPMARVSLGHWCLWRAARIYKTTSVPTQMKALNRRARHCLWEGPRVGVVREARGVVWGRGRDGRLGHGDSRIGRAGAPRVLRRAQIGAAHHRGGRRAFWSSSTLLLVPRRRRRLRVGRARTALGLGRTLNKKTPQNIQSGPRASRGCMSWGSSRWRPP